LTSTLSTETFTNAIASQQVQKQTYYVATNGNDSNPGTEVQPFRTIAKGISVLGPGDTLLVKSGTYGESLRSFPSGTSWNAPVTVATYPGARVIINGSYYGYVAYITNCSYVVLDGLVFDGVNGSTEGILIDEGAHHIRIKNSEVKNAKMTGILVNNVGSPNSDYNEFINLDVHDNGTTDFDHGLYIETANNLVEDCRVYNNSGWGVHIYNGSSAVANNNTVRKNKIYDNARTGVRGRGIILSSGSGNIAYDNLIWGNQDGIQIAYNASNSQVYNNTIYANDGYGIVIQDSSTHAIVKNNISYQNPSGDISDGGSGTIQDHNLVGNNPKFVNAGAHDFHLEPISPAIDAGIPLSQVSVDFDGAPRPSGAPYDIGAYELHSSLEMPWHLYMPLIMNH
jgi:parallel beta-helix repeat protein